MHKLIREIEKTKERSKPQKCLRHLDATMDLFMNKLVKLKLEKDNNMWLVNVTLKNQKGKEVVMRYSFGFEISARSFMEMVDEVYLDKPKIYYNNIKLVRRLGE